MITAGAHGLMAEPQKNQDSFPGRGTHAPFLFCCHVLGDWSSRRHLLGCERALSYSLPVMKHPKDAVLQALLGL